ncbi:cation channel sperm-associated auxiliary subunit TMEM249-like [Ptychodera flava]|uniref:cation channel sperm-associated auxiliary subunit TMEM249-like n=1 Tax=Ptychodera flava TaxID=63121 RepID=UPI003969CB4F
MIVGIFGKWDFRLKYLTKPEETFKKNLEKNHTYPFTETDSGYFEYETRSPKFWQAIVIVAILVVGVIGYYADHPFDQNLTLVILVVSSACYIIFTYKDKRRIVINTNTDEYGFYIGEKLMYRGHIHNIYIRLRGLKGGGGDMFFNIVLNGYHVEEQELSSTSTNKEKFERLGKLLAARMNLNYFDFKDVSTKHILSITWQKTII